MTARALAASIVALLLVGMSAHAERSDEHTFTLDPRLWDDKPGSVHVAGTFNGWSADAAPLARDEKGVWHATLDLDDGVYHYKFVIDGDRWIAEPAHADAELDEPDGFGGTNTAILIGFDPRKLPPAQPDHINTEVLRFDPATDAAAISRHALHLHARAQAGDLEAVVVEYRTAADAEPTRVELPRLNTALGYDHFGEIITTPTGALGYTLTARDGTASHTLGTAAFGELKPAFTTPAWARDAVWYQVFPERFRNGDPSNDPGEFWYENRLPWAADWWKTHPDHGEVAGDENFYRGHGNVWKRRFGGDLRGLQDKLPYLRSLGVNAIYLNPVFEADSMHKYDTSDFRHIDDNFGVKGDLPVEGETDDPATWQWSESDELFLAFIEEAHAQGFKVVIDGVFNHVGRSHPFFVDVLRHGQQSRYAEWFEITDWGDPRKLDEAEPEGGWQAADIEALMQVHGKPGGVQWRAWDGDNGHLPVFRKDDKLGLAPGPRDHIFAITRRWLAPDGDPRKGVDGFRLDVPGDIPHPFWIDWRKHVKAIKPDAYISGEIWSYAQPWLQGDQFDAVMNYPFAMAAQDFFVDTHTGISASQFGSRLAHVAYAYPLQVSLVQMNLIDSHDTDRLASMFVNPDRNYDQANRIQDNGPDYSPRAPDAAEWTRMKQAVTAQMTFLGTPMIYYGSEAGMWSPDDPSNRMPMVWRDLLPYEDRAVRFNEPVFEHYRKLIAIRHALPALRHGAYRVVHADDEHGVLVFDRFVGGQHVFVVLNRGDRGRRVRFDPGAELPGGVLVDLLRRGNAEVADADAEVRDGRPTIRLADRPRTVKVSRGVVSVNVPAYGAAVLVAPDALKK